MNNISHRQALGLMVALLIGLVFIYTYDIVRTPPGIMSDNIYNLTDAMRIDRGYSIPMDLGYRSAASGRGDDPEIFHRFMLAGWFLLVGSSMFTAQLMQIFINLISVVLTYRAGLLLLKGRSWRRLGSLVAAGIVGSSMAFVYLSRVPYRSVLVQPVALLAFIALLSASRSHKGHLWFLGGFFAGLGVHTYTSGIIMPFWAMGFLIHQALFMPCQQREHQHRFSRNFILTVLGALSPLAVWAGVILYFPQLFSRVNSLSRGFSIGSVLNGLQASLGTYFFQGHPFWASNYNLPSAPMLPTVPAILALIGIGFAVWHWRRAESALLLGGVLLFSLPGALSIEPTLAYRLIGAVPLLGLLAGQATVWLLTLLSDMLSRLRRLRLVQITRVGMKAAVFVLIGALLVESHVSYQNLFADPPVYPDVDLASIYKTFNVNWVDSMKWLAQVDQPTYVPLWTLDNPTAAYYLQREAFPNVTTWARYGLEELPQGQFFFPAYWYDVKQNADTSTLRALLLPREKTIVILPASGLPDSIAAPAPVEGEDGVSAVKNARSWTIGYVKAIARNDFTPNWPATLAPDEGAPFVGKGLRLLTRQAVSKIEPGKAVKVTLEWLVTARQPADLFSVVQLLKPDFVAVPGGSDHSILTFIYPSPYWQPGDIIPDEHTFTIPYGLSDGVYRLGAGAYLPPSSRRWATVASDDYSDPQLKDMWVWNSVRLSSSTVPKAINLPTLPSTAIPIQAKLGKAIALEGYELRQTGDQWQISLYWRAQGKPSGDYTIFVHAERDGKLIAQQDSRADEDNPTSVWSSGELNVTTQIVTVPPDDQQPPHFYVGMYDYPSLKRLPVLQNGTLNEDRRVDLGKIAPPTFATFEATF